MKVQNVSIDSIKPYERNPRKNESAIEKVANSIKEFGFKQPIVVDANGVIVAGHTRWKAAKKLGMTEVPVVYANDLTPEQVKAYRLADNKTAEFAEWDAEMLGQELEDLYNADFDMQPFGFEPPKLEPEEDDFDIDEAMPDVPDTKRGDIYLLGEHRLMCGDATLEEDMSVLMEGAQADMVFTDPPYNVDYEGKTKDALKIKNDKMVEGKFYAFLYDSFVSMYQAAKPGAPIYVCHADSEGLNFRKALKDSGWLLKQTIIWVKNTIVMGRQDHHWQHEPILYGWKPGARHTWYGGRKQSTVIENEDGVFVNEINGGYQLTFNNGMKKVVIKVPEYTVLEAMSDEMTTTWRIEKPIRNGEHPTMKPIKLCARAIKNSSREGDIVLDPFGGSGSTLIACEQLERKCYTMELDERYCDVIVKRWEQLTGEEAIKLN